MISLRNERVGIYAYASTTTNGLVSTTYTKAGEYWGRIQPPSGAERDIAQKANYLIDAVITLSLDTPVDPKGLLMDAAKGVLYKIVAVLPRTQVHEQVVLAQSATDAQSAYSLVN